MKLRFVIGEGLSLLQDEQKRDERVGSRMGGRSIDKSYSDVSTSSIIKNYMGSSEGDLMNTLSQFLPKDFQDQLIGTTISNNDSQTKRSNSDNNIRDIPSTNNEIGGSTETVQQTTNLSLITPSSSTLKFISEDVAFKNSSKKWLSAYFQLDPTRSLLIRSPSLSSTTSTEEKEEFSTTIAFKSKTEILEFGGIVMQGAKALFDDIMKTDEKLLTSNKYSKRYTSDNSLAVLDRFSEEEEEEEESNARENHFLGKGIFEGIVIEKSQLMSDAWKERIMYQLEQATEHMNNTENANNNINIDIDAAEDQQNPLSLNKSVEHNNKNEDSEGLSFENFLFGGVEQTKALTSQSKSLPPLQITSSLYDLTQSLESFVGGDLMDNGSMIGAQTRHVPSIIANDRVKADKVYFLFYEALPLWLTTFSPLNVDMRRVLWPRNIALTNNSTTEQNDDVSQILMGGASVFSLGGNTFDSKDNQSNQWRDMIEEKKLNPASRRQT